MGERLFRDRRDAGRVLAGLLKRYEGLPDVIALGLARGGVPVAYEIAGALDAALDVLLVRKLGYPGAKRSRWAPSPVAACSWSTRTWSAVWMSNQRSQCWPALI